MSCHFTVERWYRQSVIVIWPREHYFGIWAREGQASAIPALEKMVPRTKKAPALESCRSFAGEIIGHWQPRQSFAESKGSCSGRMLKVLERVGTPELVQRFLREVLAKDFDSSEGEILGRICDQFGWETVAVAIQDFLAKQNPDDYGKRLGQIVSICESLCCDPPALTKERRAACPLLADELAKVIERWDAQPAKPRYREEEERTGVVASVVRIFSAIALTDDLDRFLARATSEKRVYDLHKVLIPDVKAIHEWLPKHREAQPAFSLLVQHCLAELRAATAQAVEPPQDWKRDDTLGCKCEDCRALGHFLRDPTQRIARFPLRKDRRQHLHQQIEKHQCDCTHDTERSGSPQTLVCIKNQGSYERRLKQYEIDKKLLAELETLAGSKHGTAAKPSARRRTPKT